MNIGQMRSWLVDRSVTQLKHFIPKVDDSRADLGPVQTARSDMDFTSSKRTLC